MPAPMILKPRALEPQALKRTLLAFLILPMLFSLGACDYFVRFAQTKYQCSSNPLGINMVERQKRSGTERVIVTVHQRDKGVASCWVYCVRTYAARLMNSQVVRALKRGTYKATPPSSHSYSIALDRVKRGFNPTGPIQIYDNYLTCIRVVHSRLVVQSPHENPRSYHLKTQRFLTHFQPRRLGYCDPPDFVRNSCLQT